MIGIILTLYAVSAGAALAGRGGLPAAGIVLNTWSFGRRATEVAWETMQRTGSTLDAVESGCNVCELKANPEDCDGSVGWGSHPDSHDNVTLDALIMSAKQMSSGAVGSLGGSKRAISVARAVMEHTQHSLLVGPAADDFAREMGFRTVSLSSNFSQQQYLSWLDNNCQPNYWVDVTPDPKSSCGPYSPRGQSELSEKREEKVRLDEDHDTLSMIAMSESGEVSVGVTSNGANHKIAGRVGDAAIVGAGAYASLKGGAAVQTGDGDVMMKFLPTFNAVRLMESGVAPGDAVVQSLLPIYQFYPNFSGAMIAVNPRGDYAANCFGFSRFSYCLNRGNGTQCFDMECLSTVDKTNII